MPALYAHDRFGLRVKEQMNPDLVGIAARNDAMYRMGLQGPDIFFFYHPWKMNRIRRYGSRLHESDAAPFFRHALSVVRRYGRESGEYAYLLGFICHFVLDSECHPYIEKYIQQSGVAHIEIEEELEKELLRLDGRDPVGFPLKDLVRTDAETAAGIASFYPSMDPKTIQVALRDMKLVKRLFTVPNPLLQGAVNSVMKAAGVHHEMNGLMNQRRDNPLCIQSNQELVRLFDAALPLAANLQEQFDECLRTGCRLPERFHRNLQ